jgi:glycogen synthase
MAMDNSWDAAAQKYVQLYQETIDLDSKQQTANS